MKPTVSEAIALMADEAERRGENANDDGGTVRAIVTAHGLGFYAWFCVCCELADRDAKRQGFKNQADRAMASALARTRKSETAAA